MSYSYSYREMSAETLQGWWRGIFGTNNMYQERARLKKLVEEEGWTPPQLLNAMLSLREETENPLINRWAKEIERWTPEDVLLSEAQLVQRLMAGGWMPKEDLPGAWYYYIDNADGSGAPSAMVEQKLAQSKRELEAWLNDKLGTSAIQGGAESPKRSTPRARRVQANRPERLDR